MDNILHKRLHLYAYKVQLTQALEPDDHPRRAAFVADILERIHVDNEYLQRVCFSDESTFHISGKVNRYNVRIWGSQNPHVVVEHQRDSPKVNVWCGSLLDRVIGPSFFNENSVTANIYIFIYIDYCHSRVQECMPL